ncbi:MAG: NAD(P)-dependent oxidoreductase [Clostridiaceae bacterium]|nr:NAD(P)-dependent oxidoreductase [Clostridiaceae bacterium]
MKEAYKNVLITGGAGNLGRHVCQELKEQGYQCSLFDQTSPAEQRTPWQPERGTMFIKGQLTNLADCMRAITLSRATCIIHLAALPFTSDQQPGKQWMPQMFPEDTTMQSNVMGTYYLMDAARRLGVKKVIFASSYYTLGLGFRISDKPYVVEYLPIDEDHPQRPEDTYSLSKLMGEEILKAYARAYDIKCYALRLMGVSYPYHPYELGVSIADKKAPDHRGGPNGTTGQYADARDIAYAIGLMIEKDLDVEFDVFNISTDNVYKESPKEYVANLLPDLVELAKDMGPEDELITCQKLKDTFGYKPKYTWRNRDN